MTALTRGTNLPQVGEFNQAALLEAVRHGEGKLTRADLARLTGLSAQTVTNAVRRLIELGLVAEEAPQRRARAGRPGTTLRIVPDSRYAVGVHVDPAAVVVVLVDLAGEVAATHVVPTPESEQPDAVLDVVADEIRSIAASAHVDRVGLVGVGVAAPGPIDRDRAVVLDPPNLTMWHDVPLRDEVAERTGLPTLLDKDVLAVAAATLWYPGAGRPAHAAVVYAGTGVAIGVISGGEVVRGVSGNAGEAGHLSTGRSFGLCECGRHDCLGRVLSTDAIVENATARGITLEPARRTQGASARLDEQIDALGALARGGDGPALGLLADMGEALASTLVNVCDLLDLDSVVISGPVWERLGFGIEPGLRTVLDAHMMPGAHGLHVLGAVGGIHAVAIGAGCLMLDHAFTPRASGLLLQG